MIGRVEWQSCCCCSSCCCSVSVGGCCDGDDDGPSIHDREWMDSIPIPGVVQKCEGHPVCHTHTVDDDDSTHTDGSSFVRRLWVLHVLQTEDGMLSLASRIESRKAVCCMHTQPPDVLARRIRPHRPTIPVSCAHTYIRVRSIYIEYLELLL